PDIKLPVACWPPPFFFQAEDGIRDFHVTGVQTCALPIYYTPSGRSIQKPYDDEQAYARDIISRYNHGEFFHADSIHLNDSLKYRSEERRVGKEWRARRLQEA